MYFHVHKAMSDLSDHCQISLSIQNLNFTRQVPHNPVLNPLPKGYIWDTYSERRFLEALCAMSGPISNFVDNNFLANEIGVGAALTSFTTIVTTAADSSLRKTTHKPKTKKTNKKWYGPSLQ